MADARKNAPANAPGFFFVPRLNEKRPHKAVRAFYKRVINLGKNAPDANDQYIVVRTLRSFFISSNARPVPMTTHDKGSSAMETGSPVA